MPLVDLRPPELDLFVFRGNDHTLTILWPDDLTGRDFSAALIVGDTYPLDVTLDGETMSVFIDEEASAAVAKGAIWRLLESTIDGVEVVMTGKVYASRLGGSHRRTSATVALASGAVSVTVIAGGGSMDATTKVSKAGDTMTGPLVLPGDPTAALQAAPKQYVDAAVAYSIQRANHTGTQAIATVTGLQAALDAKAPLASPSFTGVPLAPTAAPGTNTTQIATTAFVTAAVAAGGGGGSSIHGTYTPGQFPVYVSMHAVGNTGGEPLPAWQETMGGSYFDQGGGFVPFDTVHAEGWNLDGSQAGVWTWWDQWEGSYYNGTFILQGERFSEYINPSGSLRFRFGLTTVLDRNVVTEAHQIVMETKAHLVGFGSPENGPAGTITPADQAWTAGFDGTGFEVVPMPGNPNVHYFLKGSLAQDSEAGSTWLRLGYGDPDGNGGLSFVVQSADTARLSLSNIPMVDVARVTSGGAVNAGTYNFGWDGAGAELKVKQPVSGGSLRALVLKEASPQDAAVFEILKPDNSLFAQFSSGGGMNLFFGDVNIDEIGKGVIMRSPDGTKYRYTPANDGALTVAAV